MAQIKGLDLSRLKSELTEAVEKCKGDFDALSQLNQILSEAIDSCTAAMSQVSPGKSGQDWVEGEERANT
jgi:hypothetical protein